MTIETDEPKVQDLQDEALRNWRVVLRNLTEIRRITGIGEIANLGKLISQAGLEEESHTKTDPRLARAIERGAIARGKLKEAEGESFSADDVAKILGISKVALLKGYKKGRLVAWRERRRKAFRFPAWQFTTTDSCAA